MKNLNIKEWAAKTEKMNFQKELRRGDEVVDCFGEKGIVVKIEKPQNPTTEDHGTIYVWQSEKYEYGSDNCEHYVFFGWSRMLRIID